MADETRLRWHIERANDPALLAEWDALLSEHRAEVERLTRERDEANAFQHKLALDDAGRIERARAEALEEVAKTAERRSALARQVYRNHPLEQQGVGAADALATLAADIRADITTLAPATIPVERVREVGDDLLLTAEDVASVEPENPAGLIRSAVTEFARRLSVDLDAPSDARDPFHRSEADLDARGEGDEDECVPAHELPGSEVPR